MRSKLLALYDDETFAVGTTNMETGIMFNKTTGDSVDYLILEYPGKFKVYLNLFDEGEPPHRNILVSGKSKSLEVAKSIAVRKLNKKVHPGKY